MSSSFLVQRELISDLCRQNIELSAKLDAAQKKIRKLQAELRKKKAGKR